MLYFTRWKALAVILTALIVCLCAVPNFFPEATVKTWPKWAQRHVVLGLDLQGGSHILLEVDSNSVKKDKLDQVRDDVRRVLRDAKVPYTGLALAAQGWCRSSHYERDGYPERPDQAARAFAAARQLLGSSGQRSVGEVADAGQQPHPADRAARRHHRTCPAVGRTIDPDRRAPHQRTRHRRTADPASGHRSYSGAGARIARSDAPEGVAGQDGQARLPHGGFNRSGRSGAAGQGFLRIRKS